MNQKNNIQVTVVIPTCNDSPEKLLRSVESVLNQSFNDWELIIVDDGSQTPFSGLDSKLSHNQIRLVRLEVNSGVARARNQGAALARGNYLAFLDSGDWWEPDKLSIQMTFLKKQGSDCCLVFCGARAFQKGYPPKEFLPRHYPDWTTALLRGQPILGSASGVIISKQVFDETGGFFDETDIPEDRDLWLRIALTGKRICFVRKVLINATISTDSRSGDVEKKRVTYQHFINRHEVLLKKRGLLRDAHAYYHLVIANKYFHGDLIGKGFLESIKSIKHKITLRAVRRIIVAMLALLTFSSYPKILYLLQRIISKINICPWVGR